MVTFEDDYNNYTSKTKEYTRFKKLKFHQQILT